MKYQELNEILIQIFPELQKEVQEMLDLYRGESPPPHPFYGFVLNPYVGELLRENANEETLKRIFSFYEEMAQSEDSDVRDLLQVTSLEYLWDEKAVFNAAKQYMLPKTALINERIRSYLRDPNE